MTQPLPTESIRDVRAHLAEVVERADRDDVPTVITRRGKEVAAVVSIEVLRKYQAWESAKSIGSSTSVWQTPRPASRSRTS